MRGHVRNIPEKMLAKLWPLTKVGVKVGLCGGSLHYTHQVLTIEHTSFQTKSKTLT